MSAALLGCYDSFKKQALKANAVIPVLFLNTLFSSLIFLPFIVLSSTTNTLDDSIFYVTSGGWEEHKYVLLKALIVLSSWVLGYFGMKHLPLTIVGPINATRPVMVLVGALLVFGERLNGWQWAGVLLAVLSFLMLSRSGKKEGIDFKHDHWIWMIVGAAALGALSGLYDKYLQCGMMLAMLVFLWWPHRKEITPFHWHWSIIGVSLFLSTADFMYFYSLSMPEAMISIVSMIRRGSVVVSFLFGAVFFHEKNLKAKAFDLALVLLGMIFLYIGSA